jgi:hypothetical protein
MDELIMAVDLDRAVVCGGVEVEGNLRNHVYDGMEHNECQVCGSVGFAKVRPYKPDTAPFELFLLSEHPMFPRTAK